MHGALYLTVLTERAVILVPAVAQALVHKESIVHAVTSFDLKTKQPVDYVTCNDSRCTRRARV